MSSDTYQDPECRDQSREQSESSGLELRLYGEGLVVATLETEHQNYRREVVARFENRLNREETTISMYFSYIDTPLSPKTTEKVKLSPAAFEDIMQTSGIMWHGDLDPLALLSSIEEKFPASASSMHSKFFRDAFKNQLYQIKTELDQSLRSRRAAGHHLRRSARSLRALDYDESQSDPDESLSRKLASKGVAIPKKQTKYHRKVPTLTPKNQKHRAAKGSRGIAIPRRSNTLSISAMPAKSGPAAYQKSSHFELPAHYQAPFQQSQLQGMLLEQYSGQPAHCTAPPPLPHQSAMPVCPSVDSGYASQYSPQQDTAINALLSAFKSREMEFATPAHPSYAHRLNIPAQWSGVADKSHMSSPTVAVRPSYAHQPTMPMQWPDLSYKSPMPPPTTPTPTAPQEDVTLDLSADPFTVTFKDPHLLVTSVARSSNSRTTTLLFRYVKYDAARHGEWVGVAPREDDEVLQSGFRTGTKRTGVGKKDYRVQVWLDGLAAIECRRNMGSDDVREVLVDFEPVTSRDAGGGQARGKVQ